MLPRCPSAVPGARGVEVVPVQQDHHQEQRPEQEAVAAGHGERRRRPAPPDDIPRARGQPGRDASQLAGQPPRRRLAGRTHRPEQVAPHGGRDQAGRHVAGAPGQQGERGAALGVAGADVQAQGDQAADGRHDPAGGRRHRVRHHQLVPGDHVRQRRRQRGQEEPVHAEDEQRRATYSGGPSGPTAISAAVATTKVPRSRADQTRIWRLDQRSMNTPANGPISEYGR